MLLNVYIQLYLNIINVVFVSFKLYVSLNHNSKIIPFSVAIFLVSFCFLVILIVTFEVSSHQLFFRVKR
jgi:hypothetical protein